MISEERIAELRSLPDRELLEEILHIAGFEKAEISNFHGVINP
jgi:hypothetical protein